MQSLLQEYLHKCNSKTNLYLFATLDKNLDCHSVMTRSSGMSTSAVINKYLVPFADPVVGSRVIPNTLVLQPSIIDAGDIKPVL